MSGKRWENCQKCALKSSLKIPLFGAHRQPRYSLVCEQAGASSDANGPELVTDARPVWFHTFTTRVSSGNIVMWETLPSSADWDCFRIPIVLGILKTQNRLREECCAFL